ncbi:hypothetical protein [Paenibacillus elgii]|uniref:hypothetical protein n=1 Tax=Paenibacillus elgii TaxID=189691 RepID=UPI0030DC0DD8
MKDRNAVASLDNEQYKDILLFRTRLTQQALLKVMADNHLDALVYPSSAFPPAAIGKNQTSGNTNRLSAFSGFPAISVPAGFTPDGSSIIWFGTIGLIIAILASLLLNMALKEKARRQNINLQKQTS